MTTSTTATTTFAIDAGHSTAEFAVKHMMVSTVKGRFKDLEGTIYLDESVPARSSVEATIQAASIDSGVEMRDNDLRSTNFFDVETYPTLSFKSTRLELKGKDEGKLFGELTIKDVTKEVALDVEFEGRGPDFAGTERIGFTAETSISRAEFGLTYNAVLETGGVVVGDKVKITLHIEGVRQG